MTKLCNTQDKDSIFEKNLYEVRDEGHFKDENSESLGLNPIPVKHRETEKVKI